VTHLTSLTVLWPPFAAPSGPTPYVPPVVAPRRDNDAYFIRTPSIIGLLRATGEFDDRGVIFSHAPDRDRSTTQLKRVATVTPRTFTEKPEGSERRIFRTVQYDLTLKFSANTTEKAQAESDRLQAVVRNALGGVSYGGFTSGWRSVLGTGQLDDSRNPEYRITIRGQFAYGYDVSVGLRTTTG
jgi:hypothetical protein